ncbi:hypothetical protein TNCV_1993501 [Trichonephila clavipes]|nr:hypothetical protein TNCV_1993501 [Trichonephila clavipes]
MRRAPSVDCKIKQIVIITILKEMEPGSNFREIMDVCKCIELMCSIWTLNIRPLEWFVVEKRGRRYSDCPHKMGVERRQNVLSDPWCSRLPPKRQTYSKPLQR